jgi:hypothetical protein
MLSANSSGTSVHGPASRERNFGRAHEHVFLGWLLSAGDISADYERASYGLVGSWGLPLTGHTLQAGAGPRSEVGHLGCNSEVDASGVLQNGKIVGEVILEAAAWN